MLIEIKVRAREPSLNASMTAQASPPGNHILRRYREHAAHWWARARAAPHGMARDSSAAFASFWQEMAARREDFLARFRRKPRPKNH
jgi:hypothetical protein